MCDHVGRLIRLIFICHQFPLDYHFSFILITNRFFNPPYSQYALEELKTECIRVLETNLSVDNVLEMLVIGDQHEAVKLKEAAFAFLVNRLDVFMDKNFKILWQKFKEAHPELTTETVKVLLEKQPVTKFP